MYSFSEKKLMYKSINAIVLVNLLLSLLLKLEKQYQISNLHKLGENQLIRKTAHLIVSLKTFLLTPINSDCLTIVYRPDCLSLYKQSESSVFKEWWMRNTLQNNTIHKQRLFFNI